MDFFKVEVMTLIGPVRFSVLVVMDLKTRHVEVAGIVREAYEEWMVQAQKWTRKRRSPGRRRVLTRRSPPERRRLTGYRATRADRPPVRPGMA